jgi:hypothetical protein
MQNILRENMVLTPIPVSELIVGVAQKVMELLSAKQEEELQEKMLSPADTCKLFQPAISKPTLSKWAKAGKLQEYRMDGRVFYKYSEVLQSLQTLKKYKREVYNG